MSSVPIGQLFEYVIGGGWGNESASENTVPVAVIRGADFPEVMKRSVDGLPRRFEDRGAVAKRMLQPGDIVLEISGGTRERPTGRSVFVTESMLRDAGEAVIPASFCRLVRPNSAEVDPAWLFYFLQDWWNEGESWSYQNQSTGIANFRFKVFANQVLVNRPHRSVQEGVGEILGALDDKIAVNHSTLLLVLQLLEVRYRAIGKVRHSLLFEDVARIGGGATPSTNDPGLWGQGIPWLTPTDVTRVDGVWIDHTERTISQAGLSSISSPLYPSWSIAMTSRATIGACALLGEDMAVNQGFIVLQSKDPSMQLWLYCQLLDRVEELKAWANGATFLELPKKIFRRLPVEM